MIIEGVKIIHCDCMDAMREMIAQGIQVDSIVTDPPYELGFMGKDWDRTGIAYNRLMWKLCYELLKPGGHLISFGSSRTYHRMACSIEDTGFDIRDQIMWVYGQGFPKSQDISKAIDKMAGAEREVIGQYDSTFRAPGSGLDGWKRPSHNSIGNITSPSTDAAKQWQGYGTALKPAHEPIVLARKPLSEKTIAANVLKHGTGAINIDGCRVEPQSEKDLKEIRSERHSDIKANFKLSHGGDRSDRSHIIGRFPANLIHDGSDEVEEEFAKYGESKSTPAVRRNKNTGWKCSSKPTDIEVNYADKGTASRFFYCAKASKKDRNGSKHPTVKPIALMRYLCRLVTPKGGTVLDPFAGSGTTGQAALEEGFKVILIEKEQEYITDIHNRLIKGSHLISLA